MLKIKYDYPATVVLACPYFPTPFNTPCEYLEYIARRCTDTTNKNDSSSFILQRIRERHFTLLEFLDLTVSFTTSRDISHELVRSRLCSFMQKSTRSVNYLRHGFRFILANNPTPQRTAIAQDIAAYLTDPDYGYDDTLDFSAFPDVYHAVKSDVASAEAYRIAVEDFQQKPEIARKHLSHNCETEIIIKANLRQWRKIISQRVYATSGKPHPDIKNLISPVASYLLDYLPEAFSEESITTNME